ncbi:MAG: alcohol dehydrogenase catalytic domain-containing protein [Anaerolineales bacterium]|nr:alcohol dehydrogenase catalytic domain-containing protein [Anaerolineales bacterium]
MKALVYYGIGDIRFEPAWAEPRPLRPGEVRVTTAWCGICGTDLEDYLHGAIIPREKPHPVSGRMAPLVLGHELTGRVAELGPGVTQLHLGQRVAVEPVRVCGVCYWCLRREFSACENFVTIGQMDDGGMADAFNIPAENCIPIPEQLSDELAALAEPLAVMLHAVGKGGVRLGSRVTVVGAGPIGLCGLAAARAAGAEQVIAVTRGGRRAEVAAQVGATHVLDSTDADWRAQHERLTAGRGSDVVIDCGGSPAAMQLAISLTRRRGRCVINSVVNRDWPVPALDVLLNEKEIVGSVAHAYDREFAWAVNYLSTGQVNLAPMITGRVPLAEAVDRGFQALLRRREDEVKILVTPDDRRLA